VGIVDRPGRWNRDKTVRGHDLGHCRRKVAGDLVEETAGNLAEANDYILAGQEKNIGRIEEVAVHTEVPAGRRKALVLDSSPNWHRDCSHNCYLQRYCLVVDIGSCLLFKCRGYLNIVSCVMSVQQKSRPKS
jgi:hypothetical protein